MDTAESVSLMKRSMTQKQNAVAIAIAIKKVHKMETMYDRIRRMSESEMQHFVC